MSRFDYVRYDEARVNAQNAFKKAVTDLERMIEEGIGSKIQKKKAINALEVCYMWIGKGLRDDQIIENGSAPLQEERTNG